MNLTYPLEDIKVPTLLIDEQKCRRNIRRMAEKARAENVVLRPHFKTHQSLEIGNWFREYGTDRITVSSLAMAAYFASAGWNDITVAFPLNVREMSLVNELAAKVRLHVLCQHAEVVQLLDRELRAPVQGWIKIDVGTGRTGLLPGQADEIGDILRQMDQSRHIRAAGFLAHAGHTYSGGPEGRMAEIHEETAGVLGKLVAHFSDRYPGLKVSAGDTPSYSRIGSFQGLDEIRPGNFVFYDLMQAGLGSCGLGDIAVAMACPVVALHPDRKDVILYGGGIHFSKDFISSHKGGKNFGQLVHWNGAGWEAGTEVSWLKSLSQEHGVLHCAPGDFGRLQIGGLAFILPVHSCMTANLMGCYRALDGRIIDHFTRSRTRMELT